MISMDKNLMTTVGVAVCLFVTIYLFRELTRAKDDVEQLKNVSMHLMQMNQPRSVMMPPQPQPHTDTAAEDEEDEVKEIAEEN